MSQESLPLMRRAKIDVVAYGPSMDDADGYYLVRAFASVDDLRGCEEAFYASVAWRNGPRQAVLDCIEHYASVAIALEDEAVERLRQT
jgi:hypothetical protein